MSKVTSIGEILFDVYQEEMKLGGAPFNFIYHIIHLTGQGNFISRIGNDDRGNDILNFFKTNKIDSKYLQIDETHNTGVAKPVLNEEKIPEWEIKLNSAYDFIELKNDVKELIKNQTDCLYFGTLAQREEKSRNTIQSLFGYSIKYFCDLNIRQNFYSKETIERSLNTCNVLKLNVDELKLVNEFVLGEKFETEKTAPQIMDKYNIDLLCVTRGEDGATIYKEDDYFSYKVKVEKTEIVDTVGAGDAYAAVLCIGYLNNREIKTINMAASEFAAEVVKINGALPSDKHIYNKFRDKIKNEY